MNIITIKTLWRVAVSAVAVLSVVCWVGCGGDSGGGNPSSGGNNTGGSYESVLLGGKKWMKKNLDVQTENSWCYENVTVNCVTYGRLYTWTDAKSACQSIGWRLPTDQDWGALVVAAGGQSTAGRKLKSTSGWVSDDGVVGNGTDDYGFSALPGGFRQSNGRFYRDDDDFSAFWWTANDDGDDGAYGMFMGWTFDTFGETYKFKKNDALSVRCIRDN